ALVIELLVYILRSLAVDQENKIETRLSKTEKRKRNLVNHTIYYLETHHDEEITLEQLAEMLYVTPTYLSKTFKAATGVGPINYLIQIRLNHAKELLKNDSLSVKEVAKTVGYEDAYHFSKLFKKYYGKSPSQF
ncbi:helix-turn-helix transcriptional regulator, partial [Enterococcus faecalis]|nr:helix-turn-helix transcriptional regulator [Enterococcus faecalis]